MKRKSLSKSLRFEIFKRDNFSCQYCGATPPLITSCNICNSGKAARPLSSIPKSLKDSANEVLEREEQIKGYNAIIQQKIDRIESESWQIANVFLSAGGQPLDSINASFLRSIKNFVDKLGCHECLEAMEIATEKRFWNDNKRFVYFCGICWNKIRESQNGQS